MYFSLRQSRNEVVSGVAIGAIEAKKIANLNFLSPVFIFNYFK
jgi:hypothetical protein